MSPGHDKRNLGAALKSSVGVSLAPVQRVVRIEPSAPQQLLPQFVFENPIEVKIIS